MTTPLLPHIESDDELDAMPRDLASLQPAVRHVLDRHGVPFRDASVMTDGSLPVVAVGDIVVKFYPHIDRVNFETEALVLEHLADRLPVATPERLAFGGFDSWHYIVMSRLPGVTLRSRWPALSPSERLAAAARVGELIRALHAVPVEGLEAITPEWDEWIEGQVRGCRARHERLGAEPTWLDRIDAFLASSAPPATSGRSVLLHTEIMPEHVLVAPDGPPRLTGLIDFEPTMVGEPEYELASIGLFFAEGDSAVYRAAVAPMGYDADDPALRERCLAYGLLHRYANLAGYLRRLPARSVRESLHDLAEEWWS